MGQIQTAFQRRPSRPFPASVLVITHGYYSSDTKLAVACKLTWEICAFEQFCPTCNLAGRCFKVLLSNTKK